MRLTEFNYYNKELSVKIKHITHRKITDFCMNKLCIHTINKDNETVFVLTNACW